MHHYYRLHFVCQPGGSRKTEYHVLGTFEEVKAAALADLDSPDGAYHAICYGEAILVQCWQDGRKIATIDLHPYLTYRLSDRDETLRFAGEGDLPAEGFGLDGADEAEAPVYEAVLEGEVTAKATIDWSAVPLPALAGTALPVGTVAVFEDGVEWHYGLHDEWDTYLDDVVAREA